MFVRAGARLERPTPPVGGRRCERIATFSSRKRLAIEVKLPEISDRGHDLTRVESALMMDLVPALDWLRSFASGARATLHFAEGVLALGDRHRVDAELTKLAVEGAVERVRAAVRDGNIFRTIELGPIGSLVIRSEPDVQGVQFDAFGPPGDPRRIKRRLARSLLNDAAQQVAASGVLGVIVLEVTRDYAALGALPLLADWVQTKASLAAVLVVDHTVMSDGRLYGAVHVLPGPRVEDVATELASTLELCASGHIHYNPLCTPARPCPMTWLPTCA